MGSARHCVPHPFPCVSLACPRQPLQPSTAEPESLGAPISIFRGAAHGDSSVTATAAVAAAAIQPQQLWEQLARRELCQHLALTGMGQKEPEWS